MNIIKFFHNFSPFSDTESDSETIGLVRKVTSYERATEYDFGQKVSYGTAPRRNHNVGGVKLVHRGRENETVEGLSLRYFFLHF